MQESETIMWKEYLGTNLIEMITIHVGNKPVEAYKFDAYGNPYNIDPLTSKRKHWKRIIYLLLS